MVDNNFFVNCVQVVKFMKQVHLGASFCRMAQYLEDRRDEVLAKGEKLEEGGWEDYLNSQR